MDFARMDAETIARYIDLLRAKYKAAEALEQAIRDVEAFMHEQQAEGQAR